MTHGTEYCYRRAKCRCVPCRAAAAAARRHRRATSTRSPWVRDSRAPIDRELLAEVLQEMFPFGLTDDCPARRAA